MNWKEDNYQAIAASKTPHDIVDFLKNEVSRLGMKDMSWVIQLPIPVLEDRVLVFHTYSASWAEEYWKNNYLGVDPTVRHCMTSVVPVLWSETSIDPTSTFWENARAHGLYEGIATPVRDRHGACSMLTMSRDSLEFTQSELAEKMPKIALLSQLVHAGMTNLIFRTELPEISTGVLTKREKEVIKLAAAGMTSEEMAKRLSISVSGANFHVNKVIGKLGAKNKVDAAVKAIVLDLVN